MTKISVIIPIYNVEEYLDECLDSVINQTLKDIEIICVNDGTKDNSAKIVKKYQKKDKRIILIEQENQGQSVARNNGLKSATGEYVYFLDSDDYIALETLEETYTYAKENDLDVVYFGAESFYEDENSKEENPQYETYYKRNAQYDIASGQTMFKEMTKNGEFRVSVPLQLLRREFLITNNISFVEGIIHEDEVYSISISLCSKKSGHLNKEYYYRRVRPNSTMTTKNANIKSSFGYFKSLVKLIPIISEKCKTQEIRNLYINYLNNLRNSSIRKVYSLTSKELYEMDLPTKDTEEFILYKLIIRDYLEQRKEIERLSRIANRKISVKQLIKSRIKSKITKIRKKLVRKTKTFIKVIIPNMLSVFNKTPKVSIIMPVYNVEDILRETLDYLINQTTKKIEIICVDDGSSDKSFEILKEYEDKYNNIKVLQQNHEGAGEARNKGIKEATGEYLLFLDSDDIFHPDLCKKAYNRAKLFDAEIILFKTDRYNEYTKTKIADRGTLNIDGLPKEKIFSAESINEFLYQITTPCPWSKIFKRKYVLEKGLYFQNTKSANDVFFTLTALSNAKRMAILNKVLVTYRVGQANNLQAQKHKKPLEFFKAYKKVHDYLIEHNMYETFEKTYTKTALNAIIFNYDSTNTEEAKETIKEKMINGGLEELGLTELTRESFKTKYEYTRWNEIFNEEE